MLNIGEGRMKLFLKQLSATMPADCHHLVEQRLLEI
jgi:hypothetical protein